MDQTRGRAGEGENKKGKGKIRNKKTGTKQEITELFGMAKGTGSRSFTELMSWDEN